MKKSLMFLAAISSGLAVSLSGAVAANPPKSVSKDGNPPKSEQAGSDKLAGPDALFVKTAASDGLAEVKLGQLAAEKAASADVKDFGSMMVADHGKANDELKALATAKGLEIPGELDQKHQGAHDKLAKLSGAEFDKAYVAEMLKGHKKAVAEFEKAAKSAKDAEVKAFAEKTLPTLHQHLEKVQALSATHGGEKAGKGKEDKPKKEA